jgi:hypothetical protein
VRSSNPAKKAAEPPDRDRSRKWRGETEPGRAGDLAAPFHDLDREDGVSKPAEDALADLVGAAQQQVGGAGGNRAGHHPERGDAEISRMHLPGLRHGRRRQLQPAEDE